MLYISVFIILDFEVGSPVSFFCLGLLQQVGNYAKEKKITWGRPSEGVPQVGTPGCSFALSESPCPVHVLQQYYVLLISTQILCEIFVASHQIECL